MVVNLLIDSLIRLKNASNLNLLSVKLLNSKACLNMLLYLWELGFISGFKILSFKYILVFLRYTKNRLKAFRNIKIISKPTNPVYLNVKMLKKRLYNSNLNSILVLSTHKGLMNDKIAILNNVGGKVLFEIF